MGRRHLLVLVGAATMTHACDASESPLGGPYGGAPGNPESEGGSSGNTDPEGGAVDGGSGDRGSGSDAGSGRAGGGGLEAGGDTGVEAGANDAGAEGGGLPPCPTSASVLALTFAAYPRLRNVGSSVSVEAMGYSDPSCKQSNIIVAQTSPGVFIALSQSCPHACCLVSFSGTGFNCPCHGASFDLSGACTNGRAPASLATLPVCVDDDGVYVTLA